MFFIVRALFWIGVVFLLLPATSQPRLALAQSGVSLSSVASLPSKGVGDAAAFCLRQPIACRDGLAVAGRFSARLDQGVRAVQILAAPAQESPSETGSIVPIPPPRPAVRHETAR